MVNPAHYSPFAEAAYRLARTQGTGIDWTVGRLLRGDDDRSLRVHSAVTIFVADAVRGRADKMSVAWLVDKIAEQVAAAAAEDGTLAP